MTSKPKKDSSPGEGLPAVLDRIEGQFAVLLVGDQEKKVDLPLGRLPAGAREGDWFRVIMERGEITGLAPDHDETSRRRSLIQAKLEQLRKKGK